MNPTTPLFTRTPEEAIGLFIRQVAIGANMEVSEVRKLWDAVPRRHQLALAEELGKLKASQSRLLAHGGVVARSVPQSLMVGWSEKAQQAIGYFLRGL